MNQSHGSSRAAAPSRAHAASRRAKIAVGLWSVANCSHVLNSLIACVPVFTFQRVSGEQVTPPNKSLQRTRHLCLPAKFVLHFLHDGQPASRCPLPRSPPPPCGQRAADPSFVAGR